MERGTRTKRIEIASNFFLSFTRYCKYCRPPDYYHLHAIFLANIVGTPSKLPMYNGGSTSILYRRQQRQEQSTGFESGEADTKCCFSVPQVFTLTHWSESFIQQRQKGLESLFRTYLRVGYGGKGCRPGLGLGWRHPATWRVWDSSYGKIKLTQKSQKAVKGWTPKPEVRGLELGQTI